MNIYTNTYLQIPTTSPKQLIAQENHTDYQVACLQKQYELFPCATETATATVEYHRVHVHDLFHDLFRDLFQQPFQQQVQPRVQQQVHHNKPDS